MPAAAAAALAAQSALPAFHPSPRLMIHTTLTRFLGLAAVMLTAALASLPLAAQTMVRLHTTQGPIDFRLLDAEAPRTTSNFLGYVRGGDYADVFFHRSAKLATGAPFVIQAGGFRWTATATTCCASVTSRGTVVNEFSATRSNLRGTVAMAKTAAGPDTATNQWFINMGDNAANLDNQNGGFTVFARVTAPGMVVADRIAALRVINAGGVYNELPVANYTSGVIGRDNLVRIDRTTELVTATDFDRVANHLEAAFPQFLAPAAGVPGNLEGIAYRAYGGTSAYIGVANGRLVYLGPLSAGAVADLGPIADWLAAAQAAGY